MTGHGAKWQPEPTANPSELRHLDGEQWDEHSSDASSQKSCKLKNPLAIVALLCGIVGYLTFGLSSIAAIALGIMGRRKLTQRSLATAGLVLGIASIIGWIIVGILSVTMGVALLPS